jgi:hypothetical protein
VPVEEPSTASLTDIGEVLNDVSALKRTFHKRSIRANG